MIKQLTKKSLYAVWCVVAVLAAIVLASCSSNAPSPSESIGLDNLEMSYKAGEIKTADGQDYTPEYGVRILHHYTLGSENKSGMDLVPGVVPGLYETVSCGYATQQYVLSEDGSGSSSSSVWPQASYEPATYKGEPGVLIRFYMVPPNMYYRANVMVPADANVSQPHLVEGWRVLNFKPGSGGVTNFFLSNSEMGEYPDNALSTGLFVCGDAWGWSK